MIDIGDLKTTKLDSKNNNKKMFVHFIMKLSKINIYIIYITMRSQMFYVITNNKKLNKTITKYSNTYNISRSICCVLVGIYYTL